MRSFGPSTTQKLPLSAAFFVLGDIANACEIDSDNPRATEQESKWLRLRASHYRDLQEAELGPRRKRGDTEGVRL